MGIGLGGPLVDEEDDRLSDEDLYRGLLRGRSGSRSRPNLPGQMQVCRSCEHAWGGAALVTGGREADCSGAESFWRRAELNCSGAQVNYRG